MKRVSILRATTWAAMLLAPLALSRTASGQDVFTLGFEGAAEQTASGTDTYFTTLTHAGAGANAQGWSYGAVAENATINSVTLTGSASEIAYVGGFDSTELVMPEKNPGVASGMVSAVVLHLKKGTTLPANTTSRISVMEMGFVVPAEGGLARLAYKENLVGSGEPVPIVITQAGDTKTAVLQSKEITFPTPQPSCCDDPVIVGFSGTVIRTQAPFTGLVNGGPPECTGAGGEIPVLRAEGGTGVQDVYVGMVSNIPAAEPGLQGWSYGVALSGDGDFVPGSVTLTGTFAEAAYVGGFDATEVILPENQTPSGQKGMVSAVVLHLKKGTTLPRPGTDSVACMQIQSAAPQGVADQVVTLAFKDGLVGSGEPVPLVITIGGDSASACNFTTANVKVAFKLSQVTEPIFRRGFVNPDNKFDIADPIWIINDLFRDGPPTACQKAADANDDGVYDSSDAVYLINYLFKAGPAPAGPTGSCGPDPTPDNLPCDRGATC